MGGPAGRSAGLTTGDRPRSVVDLDATGARAPQPADRAVARLTAEGVVLAERTPCVPGRPRDARRARGGTGR
ncbi:hypothetical protein GCM10019016_127660 [Streptomyces prasinosporus]|uniref:Uncharacterized protein n=1 Tax=Streptomyces prasinosporus TaxID=68256 RepID=A0ABP6UD16_9ACTN